MFEIVLASKSKVREEILKKNNFICNVQPSNVDEEPVKESLINCVIFDYTLTISIFCWVIF